MSDFNENQNSPIENDMNITEAPPQKKTKALSDFIDYVELFAVAITIVIVLFSVAFRTCTVDGDSMNNTLIDKEVLIVSDFLYTPKQGDIIVFHQTGNNRNMPLVKRVIGVGGDTVKIDFNTWTVTVTDKNGNSTTLEEPYIYIDQKYSHLLRGTHEFEVPEGSLFVLGDNRNHSLDSTSSEIGFVDARRVLGKVVMRISPLSKFGTVN